MARVCALAFAVALLQLTNSCSGEAWSAAKSEKLLRGRAARVDGIEGRLLYQEPTIEYPLAANTKYLVFGANAENEADNVMGPGVVATLFRSIQSGYDIAYEANFTFPESKTEDYLLNISIAIGDSEIVVVGLPNYENGGVVALYSNNEDKWGLLQTLTAPSGSSSKFGLSVDISGSRIVVGDGGDKVFIFNSEGSSGQFSLAQTLTGDGGNVAIKGSLLVVGYTKLAGGPMASVYQLSSDGEWKEVYAPLCPDCISDKDHGFDVAVSESTVVVSTYVLNETSSLWKGYVYALNEKNGIWHVNGTIGTDGYNGNFGISVSVVNKCILIGAPLTVQTGHMPGGAISIYAWMDGKWTYAEGVSESGSYISEFVSIGGDGSDDYPYVAYASSSSNEGTYYAVIQSNGGDGVCNY